MDERGERIARNEAAYRDVNEAIEAGRAHATSPAPGPRPFVCECGQLGCNQLVELTADEYEAVRAHPRRFFMVDGHEIPDVEMVVARHERYVVAEKVAAEAAIAEDTDPRSAG
jgi:hypothetical protein